LLFALSTSNEANLALQVAIPLEDVWALHSVLPSTTKATADTYRDQVTPTGLNNERGPLAPHHLANRKRGATRDHPCSPFPLWECVAAAARTGMIEAHHPRDARRRHGAGDWHRWAILSSP